MALDHKQFVRAAELLSQSNNRMKVFQAIYKGKKEVKTVVELERSIGFDKKTVLGAGKNLVTNDLAVQGKSRFEGQSTTHYEKIPSVAAKKEAIVRLARNKARLKKELDSLRKPATTTVIHKTVSRVKASRRKVTSVLRVSASPTNTSHVRADREFAEIENAIERSKFSKKIKFHTKTAVTPEELQNAFNEAKPNIFHFSGHSNRNALLLDDGTPLGDKGKLLTYDILARLINSTSKQPEIVFLNSCFSAHAATDLLKFCQLVIGMNDTIDIDAAGVFAKRFYAGVANGETIENCVEQGKIALAIDYPDAEKLIEVFTNDESSLQISY